MNKMSKIRIDLLKTLWRIGEPAYLKDIVKESKLNVRRINMHLLNLRKRGYVRRSSEGFYSLTDLGKEALGFPKINGNLAKKILNRVSPKEAFHFYSEVGKPLMVSSDSLEDFCEKIGNIDLKTLEFHSSRGDFERWIRFLGDVELAERLKLIRKSKLSGEDLREKLRETVRLRCQDLRRIASSA